MREDQIQRYARHILLPDVGGVGQRRLLAGVVAIADAGLAGSAAIVYLAAAGVGRIAVADARAVTAGDVGPLYEAADIGRPRREAARARVAALNPDVTIVEAGGVALELVEDDAPARALQAGAAAAARAIHALAQGGA